MNTTSLNKEKVFQMLTDLESEQIERTVSTSDTNKFAQMEERILIEKRTANVSTFDIRPSIGNGLGSINKKVFSENYLPLAIDSEILINDTRDITEQLASLRFYSNNYSNLTNAGLLVFGNEVEMNIPGAYVPM